MNDFEEDRGKHEVNLDVRNKVQSEKGNCSAIPGNEGQVREKGRRRLIRSRGYVVNIHGFKGSFLQ